MKDEIFEKVYENLLNAEDLSTSSKEFIRHHKYIFRYFWREAYIKTQAELNRFLKHLKQTKEVKISPDI